MYSVSGSVMEGNQKAKLRPTFDWLQIIFFGLIMLTWKTQLKPPLSSRYHRTVQFLRMSDREPIFTSCNTLRCWGSTGAPLSEVRPPKKFLPDVFVYIYYLLYSFLLQDKIQTSSTSSSKTKEEKERKHCSWEMRFIVPSLVAVTCTNCIVRHIYNKKCYLLKIV